MNRRKRIVIFTIVTSLTVASGCGGGGFLKWFWETFGWCGGAVVNCVFFQNCSVCTVPPRTQCRAGCSYGHRDFSLNNGSTDCVWQRDPKSNDCGRTINIAGRTTCDTACIESPLASVGYDALRTTDQQPPSIVDVSPAQSSIYINADSEIRVQFAETIQAGSVSLSGDLAAEANGSVELRQTTLYNDTAIIRPATRWAEGVNRTITVSANDEALNSVQATISYFRVRDLNLELTRAAGQADALRQSIGWPGADAAIQRTGANAESFVQYHAGYTSAIYVVPSVGAVAVYGDIYIHYAGLGAHNGSLGLPISSEYDCGLFLRCSEFAHGQIMWQSITRAINVTYR